MPAGYDIQQVCESGHQITGCIRVFPEKIKNFCPACGDPTLTKCPSCGTEIQGAWIDVRVNPRRPTLETIVPVPSYCRNCGEPYPWTKKKIVAAIQTLTEFGNLEDKEKETIEQDVENIAKDVPETDLSARRIKRIVERCKNLSYEFILEFASRTAAKIFKGP